jgi:hypothetical protein
VRATVFKEVNYSLSKLIEDIDVGEIGLPDIQRPFVWTKAKVRDLFDSMYSGFPVGYLLFWSNGRTNGSRQIGIGGKQAVARLLIVDGQQRLTSLYAVLKGLPVITEDYSQTNIGIAFRPRDRLFAVTDAAIARDPEYIPNISELWASEISRNRFVRSFLSRLSAGRELSDDEEDQLTEAIDGLYDLQSYPFTALELSSTINEEQVADVFVRINSKGVSLNQADFILTLMSVWWDEGRAQLEAFSRSSRQPSTGAPSSFNHFIEPDPDQLLRVAVGVGFRRGQLRAVYSLLRGRDMETEQYLDQRREEQFDRLRVAQQDVLDLTNWHDFLKALVRAGFRSGSMISSENAVLYAYVFYLVGKRDFGVEPKQLRELIARWFFMVALTARYTGSPESRVESDLALLRGKKTAEQFAATLDGIIDAALTQDFWQITLPNALASSAAGSPSLYAYYAALNLLDAKMLFSKRPVIELLDPALRSQRTVERHQLFPRAHLKTLGIESPKDFNQIANFALVEWSEDSSIAGAPPQSYWPWYLERHTDAEIERMCRWHALPDGWESMTYEQFLPARRRLMGEVIRDGFSRLRVAEQTRAGGTSVERLIAGGEGNTVEFKATARCNQHTNKQDPRIEMAIVKTIAGFANCEGGALLIGVNDAGKPIGLDQDLRLVKRRNLDGYQLFLGDLLEQTIGKPATANIKVSFPTVKGKRVCRIDVKRASSPVFVDSPGGPKQADFYVRIGNSTRQLTTDEVLDYQRTHWKGRQ